MNALNAAPTMRSHIASSAAGTPAGRGACFILGTKDLLARYQGVPYIGRHDGTDSYPLYTGDAMHAQAFHRDSPAPHVEGGGTTMTLTSGKLEAAITRRDLFA